MKLSSFLNRLKRYDENAAVIFDKEEPIGSPTDLVMPPTQRFLRKRRIRKAKTFTSAPNE